jgi:hypothetical protein
MTGICHIQTPDRDLQFHLIGSVLKRRNMAARKRTVTYLPDSESRPTTEKEVALMRRTLLVMSVATLMAAMLAVMAEQALATVHPLANSECANENASGVATFQDPPGISPDPLDREGNDPDRGPTAQPVRSVATAQGPNADAFKTPPDPNSPIQEYCPAQR